MSNRLKAFKGSKTFNLNFKTMYSKNLKCDGPENEQPVEGFKTFKLNFKSFFKNLKCGLP